MSPRVDEMARITVRAKALFKKDVPVRTEWRRFVVYGMKYYFRIIALHFITDYAFTWRSFAPCQLQ